MQRLAAGEEDAVREVYARYGGPIFGLARRMLGDHHLAEEATQQTFVQAYRAAARFDTSKGTVSAWLYQICRRASIDLYRRERRHRNAVGLDGDETARLTVLPAGLEAAWESWQVDEAVAALPDHQRMVIDLCAYQGFTHVEAADELGIPLGTVKSRLFKAYRTLGARLAHVVEEAPGAV